MSRLRHHHAVVLALIGVLVVSGSAVASTASAKKRPAVQSSRHRTAVAPTVRYPYWWRSPGVPVAGGPSTPGDPSVAPVTPAPDSTEAQDQRSIELLLRAGGLLSTRRLITGSFLGPLPAVGTETGPDGKPVASIVWLGRRPGLRARNEVSVVGRSRDRIVLQTRSTSGADCTLTHVWAPRQSSILTVLVDFAGTCGAQPWRFDGYPVATPQVRVGKRL
jgi:hypothetical protein